MGKLITLAQLAGEGFAASPSEMFMEALDHGWALGIDQRGRMCLTSTAADKLRQQRAEREASERFERERAAAQRQREAEEAEVEAAVTTP
jgi:hypothetical protein